MGPAGQERAADARSVKDAGGCSGSYYRDAAPAVVRGQDESNSRKSNTGRREEVQGEDKQKKKEHLSPEAQKEQWQKKLGEKDTKQ